MKLYGYGFVKSVQVKDSFTAVKISCYDGKDKEGKAKYYILAIRVFNGQDGKRLMVSEGDRLYLDGAELSIYKYNEAWYTEAKINASSCWVKSQNQATSINRIEGMEAPEDDSVPF